MQIHRHLQRPILALSSYISHWGEVIERKQNNPTTLHEPVTQACVPCSPSTKLSFSLFLLMPFPFSKLLLLPHSLEFYSPSTPMSSSGSFINIFLTIAAQSHFTFLRHFWINWLYSHLVLFIIYCLLPLLAWILFSLF